MIMYHIVKSGIFLYKWLCCSWKHRKHRCYNEVWKVESKHWHCDKCHPCGEEFTIVLGITEEGESMNWKQKVINRRINKRLAKENK